MKQKFIYLLIVLFAFSWHSGAQVSIGNGTDSDQGLPVEPYYGYSYSQVIYLQSEINASGDITTLTWDFAGTSISNSNEWTIYMGHTTKTEFSSTTDWVDVSTLTQVFSGTVTVDANNKVVVDITDFTYNNTDNLIIAVDENASSYNSNSDDFNCTAVSGNRGLLYRNDSTNPDPANPPTASYRRQSIANIVLGGITQTCPTPSNGINSNITTNTANFDWTANGSEGNWTIEYKAGADFTPGTGAEDGSANPTTHPYNIGSLSTNTTYYWYVRANCSVNDSSSWAGPYTFTTLCNPFTATYTENFDGVSTPDLPSCWHKVVDASSSYAAVETTSTNNSSPNSAKLYNSSDSNATLMLISPQFSDLTSQANRIRFYAKGGSDSFDLIIGTMSDPFDESTFTAFTTITLTDTFAEYMVNFDSNYNGSDEFIVFKHGLGGTYRTIYLDDFTYEPIPSCPEPTDLSASNITDTTADLSWNGSVNIYNIEIVTNGTQPTGTPTATGVTSPYTANSLTPNTPYDYYVQADCGGGSTSTWAGPYTFTTSCSVYIPDYTQDFATFLPDCWDEANSGDATSGPGDIGSSPWMGSTALGTGSAKINLYYNNHSDWLLSPEFDLSAGGYEVVVEVAVTNYNNGDPDTMGSDDSVQLLYTEDGTNWTNITTWTAADNLPNSPTQFTFSLSSTGSNVQFGILASDGTTNDTEDYDFHVANFIVRTPPACPDPSGLSASNITSDSAELSWTENGSATVYNIELGLTGFNPTGNPTNSGVANPFTVTGLNDSTTYDYYVQADCGGGSTSNWVGPYTFSTPDSCPPPSAGITSNITSDAAELGWTPEGTENSWIIEYGEAGFTQGQGTTINVSTNPYTLSGLSAHTEYEWYIKADCSNGDVSNTWAGPYSFMTACLTVSSFPYAYGFEDITSNAGGDWSASCWSGNPENTGSSSYSGPYRWTPNDADTPSSSTGPSSANSGTMYAYTEASGSASGDIAELISPTFDMSGLTHPQLTFYYHMFGSDMGTLHVDTYDGTNWTNDVWSLTGQQQTSDTAPWELATVNIPNTVTQIRFRAERGSDYASDMAVDDIAIEEGPTCPAPTALDATNITASQADLGWTAGGSENAWNIEYGVTGFTQGQGTTVAVNANPYTLMGLNDSTTYDYYVQADCGGDTSDWTGPFTFSTPDSCPPPLAGTASNITNESAELGWTSEGTEAAWNIEYGVAGFTQGQGTTIQATTIPYQLTGLTANTAYEWYIQADCGNGDVSNSWSGPYSFTTLLDPVSNPSACGLGYGLTDNDCLIVPIDVTSAPGTALGNGVELSTVSFIIDHTYDGDLDVYLISPNGVEVELTTDNGGSGDDYGDATNCPGSATVFSMDATTNITDGTAPFIGTFKPEGNFDDFNDGSNPVGIWKLRVCDDAGGDTGAVQFVSLTFASTNNDEAANATQVVINDYDSGCQNPNIANNETATGSEAVNGAPTCRGYRGGDVWFSFMAPADGKVNFIVNSSDWSTVAYALYNDPAGTSPMVCDGIIGTGNAILDGMTPGNTYYLRLWDYLNNDFGNVEFCLEVMSSNDEATGAIQISVNSAGSGCQDPNIADNSFATSSSPINGDPSCRGYRGGDVWFLFTAPASGSVELIVSSSDWSTVSYALYEDASDTSPMLCDGIIGTGNATLDGMTYGNTYYLRMWDYLNNDLGTVDFCLEEIGGPTLRPAANVDLEQFTDAKVREVDSNLFSVASVNETNISSIMVYDLSGRLMYRNDNVNSTVYQVQFNGVSGNIYIFHIGMNNDTEKVVRKVLKQ